MVGRGRGQLGDAGQSRRPPAGRVPKGTPSGGPEAVWARFGSLQVEGDTDELIAAIRREGAKT